MSEEEGGLEESDFGSYTKAKSTTRNELGSPTDKNKGAKSIPEENIGIKKKSSIYPINSDIQEQASSPLKKNEKINSQNI